MIYIICAFAVYKTLHLVLAVIPREPMPWVKVVAGVVLSMVATGLAGHGRFGEEAGFPAFVLSSLTVATLAGLTHTVIRLLTYWGDWAARKSIGR